MITVVWVYTTVFTLRTHLLCAPVSIQAELLHIIQYFFSIIECKEGEIRLAGGNESFGRVEICADGMFGSVCDDEWDDRDAQVVCNQLGFLDRCKSVYMSCYNIIMSLI